MSEEQLGQKREMDNKLQDVAHEGDINEFTKDLDKLMSECKRMPRGADICPL